MQTLFQDLRYGARMLLKKPGFTLIAILTLALGIGANTAIFSVVNGVLLNPLPFAESSRLMDLTEIRFDQTDGATSYPNFVDWSNQQTAFERLAVYRDNALTLVGNGEPSHLRAIVASADLFPVLKAEPALGRNFLPEEDKAGNRVVMLSHTAWQKYFASDPQITGKQLTLSGKSFTVVGVMPAGFNFPVQPNPVDLWTSLAIDEERTAPDAIPEIEQRGHRTWSVIARLKANATEQQAQAEMNTIESRLTAQYPDSFANHQIEVKPLMEKLTGKIKTALLVLFGAVGFVLLIACANVANLLLARAVTRQKEIAVCSALGATRGRIVRQLLTESLLLAFVGGVLGILLAVWGTDLLKSFSPEDLPRVKEISVDGRVLAFTMLISLLTGIVFGLVPALRAARTDLNETLKDGGRSGSESLHRNRTRSALVIAEVALALMLLVSAGLLISSFVHLQKVNPGFDSHNVLTMTVDPPLTKYREPQQLINFHRQLIERVEHLPGVRAAGMVYPLPLSGNDAGTRFDVEGRPVEEAKRPRIHLRWTSIGYFHAMNTQIIKGRDFDEHDELKAKLVVIINESLARKFFPNEDPIGKRIGRRASGPFREIIGVVADVKHAGLSMESGLEAYLPYSQSQSGPMALVVRTEMEPMSLLNAVRSEVSALDKEVPIDDVKTLDQYRTDSVAQPRFNTMLLTIFASVAMILTAIGLYGVMAYSVAQRTNEIGIRMALGAQSGDVQKLIIRQGMILVGIGVAIGVGGALAATLLIQSLLFGVGATDPLTFAGVITLLLIVALLACYIPARRATQVDPMKALRYE